MSGAATIVFARADLSIPGAPTVAGGTEGGGPVDAETHFFELLRDSKPDVIVLDFSREAADGIATILRIRQRSPIPILVVCRPGDPSAQDYRIAGAADYLAAPIEIVQLNQALQQIIRVTRPSRPRAVHTPEALSFAGMIFYPRRDLLTAEDGAARELTSSESRLLLHFLADPWVLRTRRDIAETLYGADHAIGDRAIDVVVNRLRKKLVALRGAAAEPLIKTEFGRGYALVAEVATLPTGTRAGDGARVR